MSSGMERLSSVFMFCMMNSAEFPYMASHLVQGVHTSACVSAAIDSLHLHEKLE